MQSKKTVLIMGILVLVVSAAAFVGGRTLNGKVGPLGLFGLGGDTDGAVATIDLIPAGELPTTRPEVEGVFAERKDKTIVIKAFSLDAEGNVVVAAKAEGDDMTFAETDTGPKVEVVITNETLIYRETTEFGEPVAGETRTVQQTVEESTLDELSPNSMVTVWGRKNGDRIIAEVLFYSIPTWTNGP